jgi:hypothetical protein
VRTATETLKNKQASRQDTTDHERRYQDFSSQFGRPGSSSRQQQQQATQRKAEDSTKKIQDDYDRDAKKAEKEKERDLQKAEREYQQESKKGEYSLAENEKKYAHEDKKTDQTYEFGVEKENAETARSITKAQTEAAQEYHKAEIEQRKELAEMDIAMRKALFDLEKEYSTMSVSGTKHWLAEGGQIPMSDGMPGKDSVPAMLMPGEFVIREAVVRKMGSRFFNALNNFRLPDLKHFAEGGTVGPALAASMPGQDNYSARVTFQMPSKTEYSGRFEGGIARQLVKEMRTMGLRTA